MNRAITFFCFVLPPFLSVAQWSDFDNFLPALIAEAGIPGLSIAVIDEGAIVYSGAFGLRSVDTGEAVDEQTIFDAASLSKPLFAYGVMKLVEEGQFDLDKPLYKYSPYPDIESDERYKAITGRMVLSHTSGFPNWRRGELKLLFTPGERYSYSGEGFVYLMKVIEKITGEPLDDWIHQSVMIPLSMKRSSYIWQSAFDNNYAIPHGTGMETYQKCKPQEGNTAYSLQTTALDFARFIQGAMQGDLLGASTTEMMFTRQVQASESAWEEGPLSKSIGWALGWGTQESEEGQYFWQWGDNGAFKGFVMLDPAKKRSVVYFANSTLGLTIAPVICERVFGHKHPVFPWLDYGTYDAPVHQLRRAILGIGLDKALKPFMDRNGKHQDTLLISESEMNGLGYFFLSKKRHQEAKQIFRLNTLAFPYSSNVYDSYGEACLKSGDRKGAAEFYARAATMNPDNEVAKKIAQQLIEPPGGNVTFILEGYSNAKTVSLAGAFNGWSDWKNLMHRRNGTWVTHIDLDPGKYQYKFIVDGVWILDPGNPRTVYEESHNSVVEVK